MKMASIVWSGIWVVDVSGSSYHKTGKAWKLKVQHEVDSPICGRERVEDCGLFCTC